MPETGQQSDLEKLELKAVDGSVKSSHQNKGTQNGLALWGGSISWECPSHLENGTCKKIRDDVHHPSS